MPSLPEWKIESEEDKEETEKPQTFSLETGKISSVPTRDS